MKLNAFFIAVCVSVAVPLVANPTTFSTFSSDDIVDLPPDDLYLGEEETVYVENVFIPKGFDANDKIEVVVSGWKPSPCYGTPRGIIERDGNDINLQVKARKMAGRDRLCIDLAVHFVASIPVSKVPAGNYKVIVNPESDDPKFSMMEIAPPTNGSIDDFLYADVDHVSVDAKTRVVTLEGENPSPCIVLDRIVSTSNGVDTYALMPIMRKKDAICPQVLTPFKYTYKLPDDIRAPKVLVHVRSLDGSSKNKIFNTGN